MLTHSDYFNVGTPLIYPHTCLLLVAIIPQWSSLGVKPVFKHCKRFFVFVNFPNLAISLFFVDFRGRLNPSTIKIRDEPLPVWNVVTTLEGRGVKKSYCFILALS